MNEATEHMEWQIQRLERELGIRKQNEAEYRECLEYCVKALDRICTRAVTEDVHKSLRKCKRRITDLEREMQGDY